MKYSSCLLLAYSLLLPGAAMAQEYNLSVSFNPNYQDTPESVIPNASNCARATSDLVRFSDSAARMAVNTNADDSNSCSLQQNDVTYNVLNSKGETIVSFKFYKLPGQEKPRLIQISSARDLSCKLYQDSLTVGCDPCTNL